jgi:hypothetical protein
MCSVTISSSTSLKFDLQVIDIIAGLLLLSELCKNSFHGKNLCVWILFQLVLGSLLV